MDSRTYDLGPTPRPVVIRFTRADGSISAPYLFEGDRIATPEDASAVEIYQMPVYPADYPRGDEPGWGNKASPAPWPAPGEGTVTRVQVRGPEHFRRSRQHH